MEGNVHQHLVEGPINESRVHRNNGVHSSVGETRSTRNSVLLGNSNIQNPVGVGSCHAVKPGWAQHGSGNADNTGIFASDMEHFIPKYSRPGDRVRGLTVCAGCWINLPHGVKLVRFVVKSGLITPALFGNHVNDNRCSAVFSLAQSALNILDVVAIDRAQVFDI